MSENIKVFYRIFPTDEIDSAHVKINKKTNQMLVRRLQELSKNFMGKKGCFWQFDTDGIFENVSQEQVFETVVADLLPEIIKGRTAVVAAFGPISTGKTFTISGLNFTEKEFGILPRVTESLLQLIRQQPKNVKTSLEISYAEFNNNFVTDLLQNDLTPVEMNRFRDISKVKVSNEYEALKLLFQGEGRKTFSSQEKSYDANAYISIVTFHVTRKDNDLTNPTKTSSKLHVLDMAGNGSCSDISVIQKNAKEIGQANVALAQLEQFILNLNQNIPDCIKPKYRLNAFLYYLDGDFSPLNLLRFIGHVTRKTDHLLLTLSTLRLGSVIKSLKSKPNDIHFTTNEDVLLAYAQEELKLCRQEKFLNSVLLNHNFITGFDRERQLLTERTVENYLNNKCDEIAIMDIADAREVFKRLRMVYEEQQAEIRRLTAEKEQIQAKSEVSLKLKGSRSSNGVPGMKMARKSKESFSSKEKKNSEDNVSEKRMRVSNTDVLAPTDVPSSYKSRRKSLTTNNTKQIALVKKRPSSTSIDKRDSRSSVKSSQSYMILPEILPVRKDSWKQFTGQLVYKTLMDELKLNEKVLREHYKMYLNEIDKLNKSKKTVDKCYRDLITAQTFRKFNRKDEFDQDGYLITSYGEKSCQEHLEKSRQIVLEHQEQTLHAQEEFKVLLENKQQLLRKLNDEFDEYCLENHKILASDVEVIDEELKLFTTDVNLEDSGKEHIVQLFTIVPQIPERTKRIKDLQAKMQNEKKNRKTTEQQKNKKWINI